MLRNWKPYSVRIFDFEFLAQLKHSEFTWMHLWLSSYHAEQTCICSYLLVSLHHLWNLLHAQPEHTFKAQSHQHLGAQSVNVSWIAHQLALRHQVSSTTYFVETFDWLSQCYFLLWPGLNFYALSCSSYCYCLLYLLVKCPAAIWKGIIPCVSLS